MSWQEIMEQVLEISELQEEILVKLNNPLIKKIVTRSEKYCSDSSFDKKSLNNAILEHKIEITPYQIIILTKINDLSLTTDLKQIYTNMPQSKEEAEKYVIDLKQKYELVNNSFNLIFNIERLSEIEYNSNNYEHTEYAKKVTVENILFEKIKDDLFNLPLEIYKEIIINNQKQYLSKLSIDNKKQLFIEILTLSYDKNSFNYFNEQKLILKESSTNKYNLNELISLIRIYDKYKKSLSLATKIILLNMSLEEIYDEFKIIYETDFFKQKINKK